MASRRGIQQAYIDHSSNYRQYTLEELSAKLSSTLSAQTAYDAVRGIDHSECK
jgi:hypothetical protein